MAEEEMNYIRQGVRRAFIFGIVTAILLLMYRPNPTPTTAFYYDAGVSEPNVYRRVVAGNSSYYADPAYNPALSHGPHGNQRYDYGNYR